MADAVTICVLSRDTLAMTRSCLDHLMRFTDVPFRLVVLDGGSRDGSAAYLRDLADRRPCDLRAICLPSNAGFARGVNLCAAEALPGSHLALVNSDALVGPAWASRLLAHVRDTGRVAAVGPLGRAFGNRQEYTARYGRPPFVDRWPLGQDYTRFVDELHSQHRGRFSTSKYLLGACLLMNAAAVAEIGLLDESMVFGADDFDWSLRARLGGYDLIIAEDVYVWHAGAATRRQVPDEFHRMNAASWARFDRKWARTFPPGVTWERLWLDDSDLATPPFRFKRNYDPSDAGRMRRPPALYGDVPGAGRLNRPPARPPSWTRHAGRLPPRWGGTR